MKTGNDKISLGKHGELIARNYLSSLGYNFKASNFRTKYGEIDLIFTFEGIVIFVEVKTRRDNRLQEIEETINKTKIKKILKSAEIYISQSDIKFREMRVDAVFVKCSGSSQKEKDIVIKHVKNFL